jgi:hypothetical protein
MHTRELRSQIYGTLMDMRSSHNDISQGVVQARLTKHMTKRNNKRGQSATMWLLKRCACTVVRTSAPSMVCGKFVRKSRAKQNTCDIHTRTRVCFSPYARVRYTAGYLSFHPMAQCVVHALKGLACRARVTPASLPASHCKQCSALTSPSLHAHSCASPSRARRGHKKHNIFFNGSKI